MKKIAIAALGLLLMGGTVNHTMAAKKAPQTITLGCSQGFQGPEFENHEFKIDKQGYIVIFDGTSLDGWRSYGHHYQAERWEITEDGSLHLRKGEGRGGDIIFAHKFKNFVLEMDWKIAEGGNSGIFYLGQEVVNEKSELEAIYLSCPEYQVLDNERHPDAKLGVDGNRKSASLYDMIPAKPQNAKPAGEWNKCKIVCNNGRISHYQNDVEVLSFDLWTPEWIEMLQKSKFAETAWPLAFKLLSNCGGPNHEGLIGMQDHGDEVWYRNIRVKVLE